MHQHTQKRLPITWDWRRERSRAPLEPTTVRLSCSSHSRWPALEGGHAEVLPRHSIALPAALQLLTHEDGWTFSSGHCASTCARWVKHMPMPPWSSRSHSQVALQECTTRVVVVEYLLGHSRRSQSPGRWLVPRIPAPTGVTMQTSAKRAKFSSVYEWLQVDRLERSQVRRGDLSFSRSGSLACLYSQPVES